MRNILFVFVFYGFFASQSIAKTAEYTFDIDYKTVNVTGSPMEAMVINDQLPAPTIEATVGDTLRVTFHNKMTVETSVHWHGILLPNAQDGVPYLTTQPIAAGSQHTFEFPVTHHGTYWYHSHTGLQEQRGLYGSIVFHPAERERVVSKHDEVVVLSDWTDEDPRSVLHHLKKDDDYYALKKGNVQSWGKVLQSGRQAVENRLESAWQRMGPMDLSDVAYDAFLVNGEARYTLSHIQGGDTVRLRIINAAASSYFRVQFAGGPLSIVAVDGVDVMPVTVDTQRLAIAETYDVIVTLPADGQAYELRATSIDATGYSTLILGDGPVVNVTPMDKPNVMLMDHRSHNAMDQTIDHQNHQNQPVQDMVEYELLRSIEPTVWENAEPDRIVRLNLTGDMERYTWSFNNRVLSEDSTIPIRRGERVQFVLANKTMMHHPIHLHGHFFRVLNGQGDYSPWKHTVNVPPMQTVSIEFMANEEKDWFFHCHNLYHMKTGMTRVVSYGGGPGSDLSPMYTDRDWFYFADISLQNNATFNQLKAETTRHAVTLDVEWDYDKTYEWQLSYAYYVNRFLTFYTGWEQEQDDEEQEKHDVALVGAHYLLPLLVELDVRVDHDGHGRLGLSNEHQLSDRLAFDWEVNTDQEYHIQLGYELSKQVVITGGRDDQFDWGIGLAWRY